MEVLGKICKEGLTGGYFKIMMVILHLERYISIIHIKRNMYFSHSKTEGGGGSSLKGR